MRISLNFSTVEWASFPDEVRSEINQYMISAMNIFDHFLELKNVKVRRLKVFSLSLIPPKEFDNIFQFGDFRSSCQCNVTFDLLNYFKQESSEGERIKKLLTIVRDSFVKICIHNQLDYSSFDLAYKLAIEEVEKFKEID